VKPAQSDGAGLAGHRHGSRARTLTATFGKTEIAVPRARLKGCDGKTTEWKSRALRAYQRRTLAADALIAGNLSGWHQHVPCAACTLRSVWWGGVR
jgi:transposase-like protein